MKSSLSKCQYPECNRYSHVYCIYPDDTRKLFCIWHYEIERSKIDKMVYLIENPLFVKENENIDKFI